MTTVKYQNELKKKREEICNFVISKFPTSLKDALLRNLLDRSLSKYGYLVDLDTAEAQFKSTLKNLRKGN